MFDRKIVLVANNIDILDEVIMEMSARQEIICILSETLTTSYRGIPVWSINRIDDFIRGDILLVLSDNINMLSFSKMCLGKGLELFKSFIPYWLIVDCVIDPLRVFEYVGKDMSRFEKALLNLKSYGEILAIYGNCQTHVLKHYFSKIKTIQEKYFIFSFPQMWNPGHKGKFEELFSSGAMKYIDVLFTQSVSENNRFGEMFSTKAIKQLINDDCKVIKICNAFCQGYYPQYERPDDYEKFLNDVAVNKEGLAMFNNMLDWNICRMVAEGKNIEEIIDAISKDDFYDAIFINERFEIEMQNYKKKEAELDIKIADFVEENINHLYLFESSNHPTEIVFLEILRRMLYALGIEDEVYFANVTHPLGLPGGEEKGIIYPSVFQGLGINKRYMNLLYKLPISGKEVSFYEYMQTYIKIVFPEHIKN